MPTKRAAFSVPEVRAKLDNLIGYCDRRIAETQADLNARPLPPVKDALAARLDHLYGRQFGLSEARELLELLEVEA